MSTHRNHEEMSQLPTEHNGVSSMDESVSNQTQGCHQMMLKRQPYQWHGQITEILAANNNPIIVGYMKNKMLSK